MADTKTKTKKDEETPETGTDLATTDNGGSTELAAYEGYADDQGLGFDNQTAEDISVPFLEVLQPGSPEVQVEDGPKAGTIVNRTTGEIFSGKDGIPFIPVYTDHVLVEWVPRDKGGGIVGQHTLESELARKVRETQPLGKYTHPENENDLIETFYVYGIFLPPDGSAPHPAVLAFSSTKIKPYKDWMFRARSIVIALPNGRKLTKLPLFSHRYRLKTIFVEKNNYKWYNWVVNFDGDNAEAARIAPNDELYLAARGLYEDVAAGRRQAATESLRREETVDSAPQKGDTSSGNAPY